MNARPQSIWSVDLRLYSTGLYKVQLWRWIYNDRAFKELVPPRALRFCHRARPVFREYYSDNTRRRNFAIQLIKTGSGSLFWQRILLWQLQCTLAEEWSHLQGGGFDITLSRRRADAKNNANAAEFGDWESVKQLYSSENAESGKHLSLHKSACLTLHGKQAY